MSINNWGEFCKRFKSYIRDTTGLFIHLENVSFTYFNLNRFLEHQVNTLNNKRSMTQIEMLMALSAFIDIQEAQGNLEAAIMPVIIMSYFNTLIEHKLLWISPYSEIKKGCRNLNSGTNSAAAAA
jgi:hypothetical protein